MKWGIPLIYFAVLFNSLKIYAEEIDLGFTHPGVGEQFAGDRSGRKTGNSNRKWFIGSTLLLLGNLDDTNNPEYIQVNAGYRITPKDVVQFRFKRSIYAWPLGIPLAPILMPRTQLSRTCRILASAWIPAIFGGRACTHRFMYWMLLKNMWMWIKKIGNGFTLYTDFYLGYQFTFSMTVSFEPAIGISFWPIRTGLPDTFKAVEEKWNNYFIQPGLDFGYKF